MSLPEKEKMSDARIGNEVLLPPPRKTTCCLLLASSAIQPAEMLNNSRWTTLVPISSVDRLEQLRNYSARGYLDKTERINLAAFSSFYSFHSTHADDVEVRSGTTWRLCAHSKTKRSTIHRVITLNS